MSNVTKAIGEGFVIIELLRHGWHVVNLNTVNNTPNADLIAIKNERRVTIQVKATDGGPGRPFRHHVFFARTCGKFLNDGNKFFNSTENSVYADYYVGVTQAPEILPTFLVMPIDEAETLAQKVATWWYNVPLQNGGVRSVNFASQVAIREEGLSRVHPEHKTFYEIAKPYINAWHLLNGNP